MSELFYHIWDSLFSIWSRISHKLGLPIGKNYVTAYEVAPDEAKHLSQSEIGKLFFGHDGRGVHKPVHYLDLYERHFERFKGKPVRFLEIGVWRGGSLELWRNYFGSEAIIYGIDINPNCRDFVDAPNRVRIGSQDDPDFLKSVVHEMGGLDVVLDDGSHIGKHQRASFEALFPLLSEKGIYVIEDLMTSYWPGYFKGGYGRRGTGVDLIKSLIDDMHGWWHRHPSSWRDTVSSVHAYDSLAVIEKGGGKAPRIVQIGG